MVESSNRGIGFGEAVEVADCMTLIDSTRLLSFRDEPLDCTNNIQSFSVKNEAFVGADEDDSALKVTFDDFDKARMKVRPSGMPEVILEIPKVRWEDIGGQHEVKAQLREAVEWPQKHQDAFQRIGIRPPTGVLLYGPPGCSKTLMARAVASEAGLNFLAVKGPQLFSKWVGEAEKAVKSLFAKARANAPSIIFLDELDSIAPIRGREKDGFSVTDRVVSQLLVEMDGLHERVNVTVIAATNCEDQIDPAVLRPGILAIEEYGDAASEITMEHLKGAIEQVKPSGK
ncbi:Calmodulin-interacting protein 111-like protein [Drosera capensis]